MKHYRISRDNSGSLETAQILSHLRETLQGDTERYNTKRWIRTTFLISWGRSSFPLVPSAPQGAIPLLFDIALANASRCPEPTGRPRFISNELFFVSCRQHNTSTRVPCSGGQISRARFLTPQPYFVCYHFRLFSQLSSKQISTGAFNRFRRNI